MSAFGVAAHIVECHLVIGLSRVSLKEHGLSIVALRTRVVTCARQRGVRYDIRYDLSELVYFVRYLVDVDARIIGVFEMVTVATLSVCR